MDSADFSVVLYGMLQYYGVISLAELLVICNQCELCSLTDYKKLVRQLETAIQTENKVFFYKKLVCRKGVCNPLLLREMQKKTISGEYKVLSLKEYMAAGKQNVVWNEDIKEIKSFFKKNGVRSEEQVSLELARLWLELNNMGELVVLTAQCIRNLGLSIQPETSMYMHLLEHIRSLSDTMPRWGYKGYSYKEVCCLNAMIERKEKSCLLL